jgi:hypothetical protein
MPIERSHTIFNPCCCNDEGTCDKECCDGGRWPDAINCDVGTLGWTDVDCDACDTLGGVYVLNYSAADSDFSACVWKYDSGVICTRTPACGFEQEARFTIYAALNSSCTWLVTVSFDMIGGDDSCGASRKTVRYLLASSDAQDCDGMSLPFYDTISASSDVCSGSYPATIELSR